MIATAEQTYSFAEFEVDAKKRLLTKNAQTISLNPKAFDLLLVLIENRGRIVTKEELLETVWANQFVEENNLTVHISALRKIFGEKKGAHQFIVTVPGKGYKFVADVRPVFEESHQKNSNNSVFLENVLPAAAQEKLETDETIIGRRREIDEIKNLIHGDDGDLITLTGAGGSGKTSLARAVAAELKDDFADGVFFVELAAATETEFVASTIAQTLNVTEASGKSLIETVKEFLRTRQILLVLDNFEQILSAAPLVEELVAESASLKVLITSRAALHLSIEREFTVLPLALPPPNSVFSVEQLTEFSAIELFRQRAQAAKPNFILTPENIFAVAEICRRLDGLPLAIELAAVRVKLLSPSAILEWLENSLNLLTGGAKDLPSRQRTMRGAIEWSYELLEEDEKVLFRRLAIFAGGFTAEAAEIIGSRQFAERNKNQFSPDDKQTPTDALNLLDSLIDNNLLICREEQTDGNARLGMLEVVREFALEILQTSGEIDDLRQVHAQYFLSLTEKAEPFLQNETANEWLIKLETEHDNLRDAVRWSLKNDQETAARIAAALRYFWLTHSHLREGLRWSKAALQTTENSLSEARLKLLMATGLFLKNQGDLEAARKSYENGLEESRQMNDLAHTVKANHGLAAVAVLQGDYAAARKFLEEALALSREIKDELQIAHSLGSLGDLEMCQKNLSAARPLLEECLTLSKKFGYERLLTVIYFNLGSVDYQESFYEAAASNFTESLRIAGEMSNKTMMAITFEGFAALAATVGNHEQSAKLAGAAESLREEIGCWLEPAEEIFRGDYLAKVRAELDERQFAALYREGKAMNSDQAISVIESPKGSYNFAKPNYRASEIIIENHSFSRILVEEEIEDQNKVVEISPIRQIDANAKRSGNSQTNTLKHSVESRSHPVFPRYLPVFAVLAVLTAIIIGGGYFWRQFVQSNSAAGNSFANVSVRQLTTNGKVSIAALAPDGKVFAYVINDFGQRSLWFGYVDGGNHSLLCPAAEDARYFNLAFAPDSSRLYFSYKDDKTPNPTLYRTHISGGIHEKVLDSVESFALSPDGKQIAFGRRDGEKDSLLVSNLDGSNQREITSFPKNVSFVFDSISWSPNGDQLAFSKSKEDKSLGNDLAIVEISSGKVRTIENDVWHETVKTIWLKNGSGIIVNAIKRGSWSSVPQYHVFQIEISSGITRQITNDLSSYGSSLDLSQNGGMILTVEHRQLNNIWIAPADNLSAARQITFGSFGKYDGLWGMDFTPDGKIIYTNSDTKSQFISEMNADGSRSKPLTAPGIIDSQLSVSGDGRYIIFQSNRSGGDFNIWRMDVDGSNPKQLTFGGKNFQSFISADNRWVYYKSWEKDVGELRRVSIDGGEPEILNDKETSWLSFSPDGKYFAASYKTDKYRLAIFDAETNQVIKQFDLAKNGTMSIGSRWSPDSRAVAYRDWNDGYWLQSIEGGEPQKMAGLPQEKFYNFAWSKDGKQFAFVRGQEIRDVVLISGAK